MTIDQRIFCNQKLYVLFVLKGTFGAWVVNFNVCWPKTIFHFSVNHKITLPIDQKTFHLQFTKGIFDQKFPTLNVPNNPYKKYSFVINLPEKVPYHAQGSKIANHQGSQCATRSCLIVYFHSVNVNVWSSVLLNFCTYLTIQNVYAIYNILWF